MPDQVKQQRFSLITDKGVCGELLISPESAIRHTQETPVQPNQPQAVRIR